MSDNVLIDKASADRLVEIAETIDPAELNQIKADIARVVAWHDEQKRNIGRPGFLYASKADYDAKQEIAKHVGSYMEAITTRDVATLEALQKSNPEWYQAKANFNTGTDAQGGYLVPDVWANEIRHAADKAGYFARIARKYPMSAQTENLTNGSDITGYEVSETGSPTTMDSSSFLANVPLTAKRFAAGYIVSRVQLRDALPAFVAFMTERLGQGLAKRIDLTAFKGDVSGASNHFNGITVASGTNTVTLPVGRDLFTEITWTDLLDMEAAVPDNSLDNAIYVMPRSVYNILRKELDQNDRPIWSHERPADYAKQVGLDALARNVYPSLGGSYPVVVVPNSYFETSAADTAAVAFGDFSANAYYGEREGMTMEVYNERWNGVDLAGHSRAFEVQASIGIAFNDPAAFAVLKTAAS